jgi:hypothetical protein
MESVTRFITEKLKVNEAKSAVGATAGAEVSRVQLYGWSGGQARDCAEGCGSV